MYLASDLLLIELKLMDHTNHVMDRPLHFLWREYLNMLPAGYLRLSTLLYIKGVNAQRFYLLLYLVSLRTLVL